MDSILRFEWDPKKEEFMGTSWEGTQEDVRVVVLAVNDDIARNSGIRERLSIVSLTCLTLFLLVGYAAGFICIYFKYYKAGVAMLAATPAFIFAWIACRSLQKTRISKISSYIYFKKREINTALLRQGLQFDFLLTEGWNSTKIDLQRRCLCSCQKSIQLILEYTRSLDYKEPMKVETRRPELLSSILEQRIQLSEPVSKSLYVTDETLETDRKELFKKKIWPSSKISRSLQNNNKRNKPNLKTPWSIKNKKISSQSIRRVAPHRQ